jgi:hypothetical protein
MNNLGLPIRREHSFRKSKEAKPLWETLHDPATQTIVIQYDLGLFGNRMDIDALVSTIAQDMHDLARRIHPYEKEHK